MLIAGSILPLVGILCYADAGLSPQGRLILGAVSIAVGVAIERVIPRISMMQQTSRRVIFYMLAAGYCFVGLTLLTQGK